MTNLSDIALGDTTPSAARAALREALKTVSSENADRVYRALRAWTWKALHARRKDPELRDWFEVMSRTGAFLARDQKPYAERIAVLTELISESITASHRVSARDIVRRQHVRGVLDLLMRSRPHDVDRAVLLQRLRLGQANLSRVLNLMLLAGLVRRTNFGKQARFRVTASGVMAFRSLHDESQSVDIFDEAEVMVAARQSAADADRMAVRENLAIYPSRPGHTAAGVYMPMIEEKPKPQSGRFEGMKFARSPAKRAAAGVQIRRFEPILADAEPDPDVVPVYVQIGG